MTSLLASPYSLSQGDPIIAIVKAQNSIGWASDFSADNSVLDLTVQVVPLVPSQGPLLISQGVSQLTVSMPEITGTDTGGSDITSYNL
jgi:hypothetical protein